MAMYRYLVHTRWICNSTPAPWHPIPSHPIAPHSVRCGAQAKRYLGASHRDPHRNNRLGTPGTPGTPESQRSGSGANSTGSLDSGAWSLARWSQWRVKRVAIRQLYPDMAVQGPLSTYMPTAADASVTPCDGMYVEWWWWWWWC